jgi:penicillin-binding protein 1C
MSEDPNDKFRRLVSSEAETQSDSTGMTHSPRRPRIDENGMPLPNRVDEIDTGATRVTPAALGGATGSTAHRPGVTRRVSPQRRGFDARRAAGCLLRVLIVGLFLLVAGGLILSAFAIYEYYSIASSLPSVADLQGRASQFETTRIFDRNGDLLYEIIDPNAGRRTYVTLDEISPNVVAATIAIEDKDFYTHRGFDLYAILRAFWQNINSGETVSGASTITQQLARALLFTPDERGELTYMRKVREAILATEIERRYSKNEILELYLNENYYGNLAYGIEAAAETYFNKTAGQLTLGEAAFVAGLPQAPSVYDIYTNRDATLVRYQQVLLAMLALSQERGCIYVSNSQEPVCVDGGAAATALQQITGQAFSPPVSDMRYPHWVQYVRTLLEQRYDPQTIYRSGFNVYTTLDPDFQDAAQQSVTAQVEAISADHHVTGGALVAIQPSTGEILAMVGSPDFNNEAASGQINMAVSPTRQPGSSIKPFTYLAAFEKGWTPATLLWDVPSEFTPSGLPNDPNPKYIPTDYDHRYRGPVTVRAALANSLNIPAVYALQFVGVYDNPDTPEQDGLIGMLRRLGFTSLTRDDYGLSLTLGGGEVSLLEMTAGYAVIANGGVKIPPVAILKITDYRGDLVYEYQPPQGEQVLRPEHAFLMSSILSDNAARGLAYGANTLLNLPFQVAAKTGTSNDERDNWTLGFTPDLAVGVWVGNPDYTPMENTTGLTGAGPIWAEVMTYGIYHLTGSNPAPFVQPQGVEVRTICAASGTQPSRWCPSQRQEYFAYDQPPLPPDDDLWREVTFDTWTNLGASSECGGFTEQRLAINVTLEWARNWIYQEDQGKKWARDMGFDKIVFVPTRQCKSSDPRATLKFAGLNEGQNITQNPLDISIVADASGDFRSWRLDWGAGNSPSSWTGLTGDVTSPVPSAAKVLTWNLSGVPNGQIMLRLTMNSSKGGFARQMIHLNVNLPTPTPTPTSTFTPSPTITLTLTPSLTPSLVPSDTPMPSDTPEPSPTSTSG